MVINKGARALVNTLVEGPHFKSFNMVVDDGTPAAMSDVFMEIQNRGPSVLQDVHDHFKVKGVPVSEWKGGLNLVCVVDWGHLIRDQMKHLRLSQRNNDACLQQVAQNLWLAVCKEYDMENFLPHWSLQLVVDGEFAKWLVKDHSIGCKCTCTLSLLLNPCCTSIVSFA